MPSRVTFLGLLALSAVAMAAPTAPAVIGLDRFQEKQFVARALVGGRDRRFLFDTGEGVTMISPGLARAIGCEPWGNLTGFRMLGERIDTPRCDEVALTLAGRRFTAPTTLVYDLAQIAGETAGLDGAIGLDLFDGRTITLRFATGEVVVETPGSARRRVRAATEVPIRLSRPEGAGLDVNLGVTTPRGRAWMELDSGNAGPTVFVSPAIAPHLGLRTDTREPQPVTLPIAPGVAFTGKARVFPGMIMDGNIGMQFMRDRDLTLDLKAGRAWVSGPVVP